MILFILFILFIQIAYLYFVLFSSDKSSLRPLLLDGSLQANPQILATALQEK